MVLDKTPTSKELCLSCWEGRQVEMTARGVASVISDGPVFFGFLARVGRAAAQSFTAAARFLGGITYKGNLQKGA